MGSPYTALGVSEFMEVLTVNDDTKPSTEKLREIASLLGSDFENIVLLEPDKLREETTTPNGLIVSPEVAENLTLKV